jgi:N-formylglutamate deformylase
MWLPEGVEPFSVTRPARGETPVVVEVPHAGFAIDLESMAFTIAPLRGVGRDADLFVDRLFEAAPDHGATLLVAHVSRLVIDLNRGPDDVDGLAVEGRDAQNLPRGLIWRTTTEGEPVLARRLPEAELTRRMHAFYEPYHAMLRSLLDEKIAKFGHAVLLCAHSMPSQGRRGHVDVGEGRADIVPGTRGRTTAAPEIIDAVDTVAERAGFSVKHDDPYKGGYTTGHYGRPNERTHAVQVEIARRLYMQEDELRLADGFARVEVFAMDLVEALGEKKPSQS